MATIEEKALLKKVKNLLVSLDQLIHWVNLNVASGEKLVDFKQLVTERRRLRRICNVLEENPSIAAYGESQKGKSYIISSLLSLPGQPFSVEGGKEGLINFIDKINPPSVNQNECTGVVTRFTMNAFAKDPDYPIKIKLLSITDIILILADFYLKDLNGDADDFQPESADLNKFIASTHQQYPHEKPIVQNLFTEDDVWNIYDYLGKHNGRVTSNLRKSNFFDEWATFVTRQPLPECLKVVQKIWDDNPDLNRAFDMLMQGYKRLEFAFDLFINFDAVYNDKRDGRPTLMSVECLDEIEKLFIDPSFEGVNVSVLLIKEGSSQTVSINKSLLCMLVKEVTYKVSDEFVSKPMAFCFDGIRNIYKYDKEGTNCGIERQKEDIVSKLKSEHKLNATLTKEVLRKFDMLDFPGLRARASDFNKAQISTALVKLLLRSKVAYLFTCYSENSQLSLLLFCHDQEMPSPNLIAPVLRNWVDNYIGKDISSRTEYLEESEISPLFLILTKYNKDLAFRREQVKINKIFEERFKTVLSAQVIDERNNTWFNEWSKSGKFDNTYLLRDYKYSSDYDGTCSHLFKGYPEDENEEINQSFREHLKTLFIHDESVKSIFKNPLLAWEVASTLGNDGTFYLIKNLTRAAEKNAPARDKKLSDEVDVSYRVITNVIERHYESGDEASMLLANIQEARRFRFEMDRISSRTKTNDFFGRLIQFLQITPTYVAEVFSEIINNGVLLDKSNVCEYELILKHVEEWGYKFDPKPEAWEENFEILRKVYGVSVEEVLNSVDPKALFTASFKRNSSPSFILSSELIKRWFALLNSSEKAFHFRQMGFNDIVMTNFLGKLNKLAIKYQMDDKIASVLKNHVDYGAGIQSDVIELMADLASSVFNSFVMNLGCDYINKEEYDKVNKISEGQELKLFWPESTYTAIDSEKMYDIIDGLLSAGGDGDAHITRLPAYQQMQKWLNYLMIAHIVSNRVPKYDARQYEILGTIVKQLKEI